MSGFYLHKYLCAHIFFLMLGGAVFAQTGTITGNIVFKDGTPIESAQVYLEHTHNYSFTNDKGDFELKEIPYGSHVLVISYFGKEEEKVPVVLNKKTTHIHHALSYNENTVDEVVVDIESTETELESKGFVVNAIKLKEIETQPIQATEVLDRSAGVKIRQNGGLGSHTHFNINGLSGSAIRVFINGSPVESFGPSFSLSSIPTNMIERIEVYKGVVPVELAGDALGGAINVVLKEEFVQDFLEASYSFGSFNTHQANLSGSKYNEKSGFIVKGSGFYNYSDNNYKVWGNQVYTTNPTTGDIEYVKATRFHDSYASTGLKAETGLMNRRWADQLLFGAVYSSLSRDIQHGATMESVYGNRRADQNTKLASVSYKDDSFLSNDKLKVELFSSYSHLERNLTDTIPYIYDWDGKRKEQYDLQGNFIGYYTYFSNAEAGNPTLQKSIEKVYVGRATASYSLSENHTLTANFLHSNFFRDTKDPLRHMDLRNLLDTRFSYKNIFGVGYSVDAFDHRIKSTVFYKYFNQNIQVLEHTKESDDDAVETVNVNRSVDANGLGFTFAYKIVPKVLIQTSAENSFRLPVATELFGNLADNLVPNYDLAPEKSKNLNLGVTLGMFDFGKNKARIKLNTFIRDTKDKIKLNVRENHTDQTTEYINDDSYISKGFDVDVFYSYNKVLDVSANASVFNSRFNTEFDERGLPYAWYQDRERNAPFFTSNGNIRYLISNLLKEGAQTYISTNVSYVHWFFRDWESLGRMGKDIIPTQVVTDFVVTHTFSNKKITIALTAKNLFDAQVFDRYALQKPGRAFYVKVNYKMR